ncbi:MAG: class I SAM-dependent rRNA methyltransferase [Planctomycetota bacterium]
MDDKTQPSGRLYLKAGRVKPVFYRHPWIFGRTVERVDPGVSPGDIVEVVDPMDNRLGYAFYNPGPDLVAKVFHHGDPPGTFDQFFFESRLRHALGRRERAGLWEVTDAGRIAFSESDGLPGLIVDAYPGWVVVEVLSLAMMQRVETVCNALRTMMPDRRVLLKTDASTARIEGFEAFGAHPADGGDPPGELTLVEHGVSFKVDILKGHKTGFYFDQRDNRRRLAAYTHGAELLDAFCYTGAFGVHALVRGGAASVTALDSSPAVLEAAEVNYRANGCTAFETIKGRARSVLKDMAAQGRTFDVVVLDPPKLAPGRKGLKKALGAYTEINALALGLIRPGGTLVSSSCSGALEVEAFLSMLNRAAVEADRTVVMQEVGLQDVDHPVDVAFPESLYLKCVFARVE